VGKNSKTYLKKGKVMKIHRTFGKSKVNVWGQTTTGNGWGKEDDKTVQNANEGGRGFKNKGIGNAPGGERLKMKKLKKKGKAGGSWGADTKDKRFRRQLGGRGRALGNKTVAQYQGDFLGTMRRT